MSGGWQPRSVLITGGLGAIGRFVTKRMLDAGATVTTFSRTADLTALSGQFDPTQVGRINAIEGDLRRSEQILAAVELARPDVIVHLAAAMLTAADQNPVEAYEVNVAGTARLLEAAAAHGVARVVVASAKAAYGAVPLQYRAPRFVALTEDRQWAPANVYGLTKRAVEDLCGYYRQRRGVDTACLRLGSTFGPGKSLSHTGYSSLKGRIVEAAAAGRDVVVRGEDVVDDLVYNRDVATGVMRAATADPGARSTHIYNISGGVLVPLSEFIAEVSRCCPGSKTEFVASVAAASTGLRARLDLSLSERELGYRPEYPGIVGVADYVQILARSRQPLGAGGAEPLELLV